MAEIPSPPPEQEIAHLNGQIHTLLREIEQLKGACTAWARANGDLMKRIEQLNAERDLLQAVRRAYPEFMASFDHG